MINQCSIYAKKLKTIINKSVLVYLVLIIVWIGTSIFVPGFSAPNRTTVLLQSVSFLGIVALGQTLVIIMAGMDLSVSGIVSLSSVLACTLMKDAMSPILVIILVLLICTSVGLFNGFGVRVLKLPPIIMTLAVSKILEGGMLVITKGTPPVGNTEFFQNLANTKWFFGLSNSVFVWLIISVIVSIYIHKSKLGRYSLAIGSNEKASYLSGMPIAKMIYITYGISAFLSAIAGMLLLGYMGGTTYLTIGSPYAMDSVAVVVIGGTSVFGGRGSIPGTVAGAILYQIIKDVLQAISMVDALRQTILGVIIVCLLLVYTREMKRQ